MKTSTLSALSAMFAGLTLAHPVDFAKRGSGLSEVDITILQFALTLEHLENTFYLEAFNTFQLQDFIDAGFTEEFFLNLQFISFDESSHVALLEAAIESAGVAPVLPCQYNFPVTDVPSFVTLSAILESVGTSAYLGAAPSIKSSSILSVAASIMADEGLHTALQRSAIGAIGSPDPFVTPLDPNSVFTLAAEFIVSCPASNPPLPFTAFAGLAVGGQQCFNEVGIATSAVEAAVTATATSSTNYATLISAASNDSTSTTTSAAATTTTAAAKLRVRQDNSTSTSDSSTTTTTNSSSTTTTDSAVSSATDVSAASSSSSGCAPPSAGSSIQLMPDVSSSKHDFKSVTELFVTFVEGLNIISVGVKVDGSSISSGMNVEIPAGVFGQTYIFITLVDISGQSFSDSNVLFGPAIMESEFLPSLSWS
ncbi:ferritin-like domain-containing protein [Exophiala viscosa]|uniref:ferritin-like domain-containing protein n=1 Tax=Exophiala viscosa TaxID=2486360 RepID=UPI00218DA462|nr:ferritin-like domain-containing protein [Exophiala viscosa]